MFMQDDDLEEEDLEDADVAIVPMSILPSASEGSQVLQSTSTPRGSFGGDLTPRSSQYNERMARARQQKLADNKRRLTNNGACHSEP